MEATLKLAPMRILTYCLMPNHWHLLLWPRGDRDLGRFMQRLQSTHVRRWHEHRHSTGLGHLYQGSYKSFAVQEDAHFLTVARYVERNAQRANLTPAAIDWRWGGLWRREHGTPEQRGLLTEWPVARPSDWIEWVHQPQTAAELEQLQQCINNGRPYGHDTWQRQTAQRLGLPTLLRPRGRPPKAKPDEGEK